MTDNHPSASEISLIIDTSVDLHGEDKVFVYVRDSNGDEQTVKSYQVRRYGDGKVEIILSPFEEYIDLDAD